ncbi:SDR family oxidoreductase [Tessaracoccus terricola]
MTTTFETLPDLTGRNALVTGASDGVGLQVAQALAGAGARVVMPVRNREKGERAAARIREAVPSARLVLRHLDLAGLGSVQGLVDELVAAAEPIHLLVLNAGVVMLGDPERHVTEDGHELHFQTNFLGHHVLTLGLLPLLRDGGARVAVQGSLAARTARPDWADLQLERGYRPLTAYARSKVALGLFGTELAWRSANQGWGLRVVHCHPGVVPDTGIAAIVRARARNTGRKKLVQRLGNSPQRAAGTALAALTADVPTGSAFAPAGMLQFAGAPKLVRPARSITEPASARRMWDVAEELIRPQQRS